MILSWPRYSRTFRHVYPSPRTLPGAQVYIKAYHAPEAEWEYLGVTPIENTQTALSNSCGSRWKKKVTKPYSPQATSWDYEGPDVGDCSHGDIVRRLDKSAEDVPSGMVRVPGVENEEVGKIDDFFMDQFEVTNKQYKRICR